MLKIENNPGGRERRGEDRELTQRAQRAEHRGHGEEANSQQLTAECRGKMKTNPPEPRQLPAPAFEDSKHHIKIYQGDCLEILAKVPEASVDLVFADPPYFLSNGGITCHAGRNRHVRDKIRQQLQILRDMGLLEFLGGGAYRLTSEKRRQAAALQKILRDMGLVEFLGGGGEYRLE